MNPYSELDEKHYWSPAVGKRCATDIQNLWTPKRQITRGHKISTYGSCFAQYFGNALAQRNYQWMRYEQPPEELSEENAKAFNYGVYSSRTANIYTTGLLKQWTEWSLGITEVPDEVWYKKGRFYDPFRPMIEPNGFASKEELQLSRQLTLESFKRSFTESQLFVFTMGLTESWKHRDGYEYPMCPGTVGGIFDEDLHVFHNNSYEEIKRDLAATAQLMVKENPELRFLLTVSPVPLTATMSGNHVLTATVESKSILRAVAGDFAKNRFHFDYFPSYEIISSTPFEGMYYNENKRTVRPEGVQFVMNSFFSCLNNEVPANDATMHQNTEKHADTKGKPAEQSSGTAVKAKPKKHGLDIDPVCEEELLNAFSPDKANRPLDKAS